MRLVAGNGIRPAKIRPEGPLNLQESACKILWSHLKNCWKDSKKSTPIFDPKIHFGALKELLYVSANRAKLYPLYLPQTPL